MMKTENQRIAVILYDRECPFGYQCFSPDCIECMKLHIEEKNVAERDNKKEE